MIRTQDEVVARIHEVQIDCLWEFATEILVAYLDFEHARGFLRPEVTSVGWTQLDPADRRAIEAALKEYLGFAWGKALDHRGLSAGRSIDKLGAWAWLLGDEEAVAVLADESRYTPYGVPMLAHLSTRYGVPIPAGEVASRMSRGLACHADCEECLS